jgi:hypothetical protein
MTFFANSGFKFPDLEQPTREAGRRTLGAASELWRIFSIIEGREEGRIEPEPALIRSCSEALVESASIYRGLLQQIPDEYVPALSRAEFELTAIRNYPSDIFYDSMPFSRNTVRAMYEEVIRRLDILAAELRVVGGGGNKRDLMGPVLG